MAKRELEAPGAGEELQTAKGRASDVNRREERCCQVYEEGVKNISTGWLPHILKKAIGNGCLLVNLLRHLLSVKTLLIYFSEVVVNTDTAANFPVSNISAVQLASYGFHC